jgi:isopentenyldiphosphate isomerase
LTYAFAKKDCNNYLPKHQNHLPNMPMYTEFLDVVNNLDQAVDLQPRNIIHAHGLRHRAVHILVFNQSGLLFMQKRSMKKDLNKGLWDSSAAGHVDSGENYDHCAARELQEELGVSAELQALFKLEASAELGMEFIQVYCCRQDGPFVLAKDEIDEGAWLTQSEVSTRVTENDTSLTETFKIIWRQYLRHNPETGLKEEQSRISSK